MQTINRHLFEALCSYSDIWCDIKECVRVITSNMRYTLCVDVHL